MPWIIGGTATRAPEGFVLDPDGIAGSPVDLGMLGGWLRLAGLVIPPAQKVPQWTSQGDGDGTLLVRTPRYANRECTMQVRVSGSSMDEAVAAIGALEGKLQEAEKQEDGLPILWTPAGASTGLTLYMLLGQITDMPVSVDDGWFAAKPLLTVAFSCKPFLYGEETSVTAVTSSSPVLTLTAASVPGDVPAEARLVVTDESSQSRRFVEWGLEQRYYNASAPVLIDSSSMVISGFAGTALAHSGAQGGTTTATDLYSQPVALCGTGDQLHVGTWRVKGRIYAPSTAEYWRLTWQAGDGDFASNDWVQPVVAAGFSEVDLGVIDVPPALSGSQKWSGRIEAYTTGSGEKGELDDLMLFPAAEGYGQFAASYSYRPGVLNGNDNLALTFGTALNARTAPLGGSWATSGATTDFTGLVAGVGRSTTTDSGYRYAILGSSALTNTEVGVTAVGGAGSTGTALSALIARWTDANNHARLEFDTIAGHLTAYTVVGGVATARGQTIATTIPITFELRLIVYASGRILGWLLDLSGGTLATTDGQTSVLATGGTLQSGPAGFADWHNGSSTTRLYRNFYTSVPTSEPLAINPGKSLEVRSNVDLRQSSDGASYGEIVARGSRLFVPAAGDANRTTRIAVRATRADLTSMPDTSVSDGDSIQAQLFYTPRYLAVPRS